MNSRIAIIIPAYKKDFLRSTLESIAAQDCKDFTVYVGDDASPADIYGIVHSFEDRIDIVYHRFEYNLGRTDLVGHWKRCIDMSDEQWIFFFSDDDRMPPDAVSRVLRMIDEYPQDRFFRFRLGLVDDSDRIIRTNPDFRSEYDTAENILIEYLSGRISSSACEYVFHRSLTEGDAFVSFPLAWCSDDATWVKFGEYAGKITLLPGAPVCWRNAAGTNISNSSQYDKEKLEATRQFICWIRKQCKEYLEDERLHQALTIYLQTILRQSVHWNYKLSELYGLCRALWGISPQASFQTALHHLHRRSRRTVSHQMAG